MVNHGQAESFEIQTQVLEQGLLEIKTRMVTGNVQIGHTGTILL